MSRIVKRRRFIPLLLDDDPGIGTPLDIPAQDEDSTELKVDVGEVSSTFSEGETLPPEWRDFAVGSFEFVGCDYEQVIENIEMDLDQASSQFEFSGCNYEEVVVSEEMPTDQAAGSFAFVEGAYMSAVIVESQEENTGMNVGLVEINHHLAVVSPGLMSEAAGQGVGFDGGTYS